MSGLALADIHHAYGALPVLRGVSVAVPQGTVMGLLGPSGCGKTTLLRVAAGLEPLQRGRVQVGGETVADARTGGALPPERRGVGLMFQDYALFPHLTVAQNVGFGLAGADAGRTEWVRRSLARLGLEDLAGRYPHTLSGGQQQRVALLRALAPEPRVLLLDEPFASLDVTLRAQIRTETLELIKETGIATLIVTHDPEEAMFMSDELLVMGQGVLVQRGTPLDLYQTPANAFVADLFGPVNRIESEARRGQAETPVGRFPIPGLPDGTPVQVLIRLEAFRLTPCDEPGRDGEAVRVLSARLIGRSTQVRLCCRPGSDGSPLHLQARVPGTFLPPEGTRVTVEVDPDRVFVFAASCRPKSPNVP